MKATIALLFYCRDDQFLCMECVANSRIYKKNNLLILDVWRKPSTLWSDLAYATSSQLAYQTYKRRPKKKCITSLGKKTNKFINMRSFCLIAQLELAIVNKVL